MGGLSALREAFPRIAFIQIVSPVISKFLSLS